MPSVSQEEPLLPSSKKRRRDGDGDLVAPLTPVHNDARFQGLNPGCDAGFPPAQSRKIAPFPSPKRIRTTGDDEARTRFRPANPSTIATTSATTSTTTTTTSTPAATTRQARLLSSAPSTPAPEHAQDHPDAGGRPSPSRAGSKQQQPLSRCHICHRKPTKKSDLDSYTDCQSCRQRACYVCLRQCLDWRPGGDAAGFGYDDDGGRGYPSASFQMRDADAEPAESEDGILAGGGDCTYHEPGGMESPLRSDEWGGAGATHHQVVCSRCCVEKGPDGEVVCFGCLPFFHG